MRQEMNKYKDLVESELFTMGPVVVFIWENKENWPVYSASKNIQRLYGHKAESFTQSKLQYAHLIHPEDIARVFQEVTEASRLASTRSFTHEPYRLKSADGLYKWVQDTTIILRENEAISYYVGYISDISELNELEEKNQKTRYELLKNEAFLRSYKIAMDASSMVSISNLAGEITYANEQFCEISGYTQEEVLGKQHNLLRHPDTKKKVFQELWKTIQAKNIWKGKLQNRGKLSDYWVDISIVPILDAGGEIVEYIAVRHDITQMKKQKEELKNAANKDLLTGFGNRYKLYNDIQKSVSPALAILNIDRFSQINDFYGHEKGDFVIKSLGENIYEIIKERVCKLYHLQGDEYVIFHPDIDRDVFLENITNLVSQISKNKAIMIDEEEVFLDFSTAISFESKEKLLITADMALKTAKKGNKSIVVYTDELSLNGAYQNNMKWAKKIKEAIERDNFVPVFQAIVNNATGAWEKYESLVRLKDGEDLIPPFFFLDISKKTKYYTQITMIMLRKSFAMFKERNVEFSINLTIEDIINEDIKKYIFELLESSQIGNRVVFEIVESESIQNFEEIALFINRVKSHGCKIAIDDFGTGYSNFEYLMKLKADYIKIDGSMIKQITSSHEAQMVVSVIVEFAKKMGMKTIAEFVENEAIFEKVKELGIDYSQGYYFSKPLSFL